MLPLAAELRTDTQDLVGRRAARRTLRLEVGATSSSQEGTPALIRNLSESGLLLETNARLSPGETVAVDLPEAGVTIAEVIWSDGEFYGCEFIRPVTKAAVSAALLRAPAELDRPLTALPQLPASAPFSSHGAEVHPPLADGPGVRLTATILLVVMAFTTAIFLYSIAVLQISG